MLQIRNKKKEASGIISRVTTEMHFINSRLIILPHLAKVHKAKFANLYFQATKESLQNHLGECLSKYMHEGLKNTILSLSLAIECMQVASPLSILSSGYPWTLLFSKEIGGSNGCVTCSRQWEE